jgi:hypothetical protein
MSFVLVDAQLRQAGLQQGVEQVVEGGDPVHRAAQAGR